MAFQCMYNWMYITLVKWTFLGIPGWAESLSFTDRITVWGITVPAKDLRAVRLGCLGGGE